MKNELLRVGVMVFMAALAMMVPIRSNAQAPSWAIQPQAYGNSMTYTGFIMIGNEIRGHENDLVAAFYNDEIRGIATPVYFEASEQWIFFMTLYSNVNNQQISFKYYSSSEHKTYDLYTRIQFGSDAIMGSAFDPVATSDEALTEAEFLSFSLPGQQHASISEEQIVVVMPTEAALGELIPVFTVSPGAVVKLDEEVLLSGKSSCDFSLPVDLTIRSGDQLTSKNVLVKISFAEFSRLEASGVVSPNGDGINDVWVVRDVDKYHQSSFTIFDFRGQKVYESLGYDNSWEGDYNNDALPTGAYYYIIKAPDGTVLKGVISLVH